MSASHGSQDLVGAPPLHHLQEAGFPRVEGGELGVQIPGSLHRGSDVGQERVPEIFVPDTLAVQADRRNPEALLEDLLGQGHGSGRHPAHVGMVGPGGNKSQEDFLFPTVNG